VLDRQLEFDDNEVDFTNAALRRPSGGDGSGPMPGKKSQSNLPGRRWPF
jgi:hypothetical protein